MTQDAVLLAGSLGLGHEMLARSCADLLTRSGWRTRGLDSMSLLGRGIGSVGERLFGRLVALPAVYDGLHFAHLRTGDGPLLWSSDEAVDVLRFALAAYASSASGSIGVDPAQLV